jgi:hypothetical protein
MSNSPKIAVTDLRRLKLLKAWRLVSILVAPVLVLREQVARSTNSELNYNQVKGKLSNLAMARSDKVSFHLR